MPNLWEPVKVGRLMLPNRLGMGPMTRDRSTPQGVPTELNAEYLRGRIPVERISDEIVDQVAAAGPGEHCARWIANLANAGADVVALMPISRGDVPQAVRRISEEVLPLLNGEARAAIL